MMNFTNFNSHGNNILGYHSVRKDHPLELIVEPVPIHLPHDKTSVAGVACGRAHTLVLTGKSEVLTLGHNGYGQCGRHIVENEDYQRQSTVHTIRIDEKISQVACGQDHS
jgi:alpha-tubulin suppressor-like RCC1 family protein